MNDTKTTQGGTPTTKSDTTATTAIKVQIVQETETVQVLTRFYRDELDAMKEETGATADATAVACFVRKNLRKRIAQ